MCLALEAATALENAPPFSAILAGVLEVRRSSWVKLIVAGTICGGIAQACMFESPVSLDSDYDDIVSNYMVNLGQPESPLILESLRVHHIFPP
jgi:hypothetical protein